MSEVDVGCLPEEQDSKSDIVLSRWSSWPTERLGDIWLLSFSSMPLSSHHDAGCIIGTRDRWRRVQAKKDPNVQLKQTRIRNGFSVSAPFPPIV